MTYIATYRGRPTRVQIQETEPGRFRVLLGETPYDVDFLEPQRNILSLLIDGQSFEVDVDPAPGADLYGVMIKGDHYEIEVVEERKKKLSMKLAAGAAGRQDLKSPMAGNVRAVLVQPGDEVKVGQVLMILEAMKMQNEIKSTIHGTVTSVSAREGQTVAMGDPLCVVEPLAEEG
ncbi:MAG: biotin/lipoyl-binding protein [Firmicutes bacterium]|nr:biotin/lipoyl-binding protein [Bacillota bacterium]